MEYSSQNSSSTDTLENITQDTQNLMKYDLNRRIKGNGVIVVSDLHGNYESLKNVYSLAQEKNLSVVINGDIVNDYHFNQLANDLGYKTQNELFFEYAQERLDEQDIYTLLFSSQYQQVGSIDPFLEQVPEFQKSQAKQQLEGILSYAQSSEFKEKFEQTVYNFKEEKEQDVVEHQLHLNSLYHVFMDEEAKRLAEQISDSKIDTIFNLGNHEHAFFVNQVQNYLDDPSKIVDATHHQGYITIEQENKEEITLAGLTNCAQVMPYLQDVVFSEQEYGLLTQHMNIDENKYQTLLQGKSSQSHLLSLEELIKQDSDYQRIFEGGEKPLDVFLTHGQVGEVMMNNGQGYDVPYLGVAAYLSNVADLTVEGHIHSTYDGKNSFGNDMIRPAGEDAAILFKDDLGNLQKEWVKIDDNFDGNHQNLLPYSLEYLKEKVEKRIELLQATGELSVASSTSFDDETKAA